MSKRLFPFCFHGQGLFWCNMIRCATIRCVFILFIPQFLFSYFPWYLSFLNTITFHYLLHCNLSIFLDFHLIFLKLRSGNVISFYFKSIIYFPVPRWSNLGCLKILFPKLKYMEDDLLTLVISIFGIIYKCITKILCFISFLEPFHERVN